MPLMFINKLIQTLEIWTLWLSLLLFCNASTMRAKITLALSQNVYSSKNLLRNGKESIHIVPSFSYRTDYRWKLFKLLPQTIHGPNLNDDKSLLWSFLFGCLIRIPYKNVLIVKNLFRLVYKRVFLLNVVAICAHLLVH